MTGEHAPHAHAHDGVEPADVVMDEAFWDGRYRSSPAVWSGRPNRHLVAEASDLAPGTALDIGAGEGADAIWLAQQGWQVTAVDISDVALKRGAALARQVGAEVAGRITWLHADLTQWSRPPGAYELVSAQFMHLLPGQREPLHRLLAESVAPGGTLLIVGHHPSDLETAAARPHLPELFFTAAEIADTLDPDEWVAITADSRARTTLVGGGEVVVHDAVLKARRRAAPTDPD